MFRSEGRWNKDSSPSENADHPDYEINLLNAEMFIKNVRNSLAYGMKTYIGDSHDLKKSLLWICFHPTRSIKYGNYATPIFLHQSVVQVNRQIEYNFNLYLRMAKKYGAEQ